MLAKSNPRRSDGTHDSGDGSTPERGSLTSGFWGVPQGSVNHCIESPTKAESLPGSVPNCPPGVGLDMPIENLGNCAFLARAIAFRVKGYSQLKTILLAEERSDPSTLQFALASLQQLFIESETTRELVSSYLNSVVQEGLDAVELRSSTQNLVWQTQISDLPASISEFTNALAFNEFFPLPDPLRKSLRETAVNAADLIAAHPAFTARVASVSGPTSAEQLAPHLVQILLSSHFVWFFTSIRVSVGGAGGGKTPEAHAPNDSYRFIRGATAVAADSVCHYWNCHFIQRLLSKIDLPDITENFSKALARTTIVPQYFKKDDWNKAHKVIMSFLDGFDRMLENAKTGLCPILDDQPVARDIFERLEREQFPREPVHTSQQTLFGESLESLLEGSSLRIARYGSDPSNQDLYTLRWVSGKTYSVSIMGTPRGATKDELARIEFLVSTATTPVRVFGLGDVYTCEVDKEDSSIVCGESLLSRTVKEAVTTLYYQLQRDLQEAARLDQVALSQCRNFPDGIALEVVEEGYRLHCPSAVIPSLAALFAHWPQIQEVLLTISPGGDTHKIISFSYGDTSTTETADGRVQAPSAPGVEGYSSDNRAERTEVSRLLHKHSFKFWQFFQFLRTNWGVEIVSGGIHKHLERNGHHFATGQDMRAPDEPLRNDIAFKVFARLQIPLSEVAQRLRE